MVEHLRTHELDAIHVSICGLDSASDLGIWNYAKTHNCAIVSKDEDFFHLSGSDTNGPPFVWVRLGNCRNSTLFATFDDILPHLLEVIESGTKVVEVR